MFSFDYPFIRLYDFGFVLNGPIPASFLVYFRSFHIRIQLTNIQFEIEKA